METTLNFMHIIYNQDEDSISFINIGKPTLKDRLSFKCSPCNKTRSIYSFTPKSVHEFLLFLDRTQLTPTRNYNDLSFKCFRIRPSKDIEDETAFNWVATRFFSNFSDSPDELRIFMHKCNLIKQEKLDKAKNHTIERE